MEQINTRYKLLDTSKMEEKNIRLKYVLIECAICNKTWGIKLGDHKTSITDRELICQRCAAELVYNQQLNK